MLPLFSPCVDIIGPVEAASLWGRVGLMGPERRKSCAARDNEGYRVQVAGYLVGDEGEVIRGRHMREEAARDSLRMWRGETGHTGPVFASSGTIIGDRG